MRIIKGFGGYLRTCSPLSGAHAAFHRRLQAGFLRAAFCRSGYDQGKWS